MVKEITKDIDIEKENREKAKEISIKEGSFFSLMDGFGLRYITPYALALGASNFVIALLSSLPQLLGNITQLAIPRLMKKISRRKIVATAVITQAFMWFPIILVGFLYFF